MGERTAWAGSMKGDIPEHTYAALKGYIDHGQPLGHFLTAVVTNDLREAVARADDQNLPALPLIVSWLYNHAPSVCWGSVERYDAWRERLGLNRPPATPRCAVCDQPKAHVTARCGNCDCD